MKILLFTAMVLAGMVVYYFEYSPVPDNVAKKDFWKFGVWNGVIGISLIIAGVINLFGEDHIYSYIDKLNGFWSGVVIVATVGACFFLPWIVRIVKRTVLRNRNAHAD